MRAPPARLAQKSIARTYCGHVARSRRFKDRKSAISGASRHGWRGIVALLALLAIHVRASANAPTNQHVTASLQSDGSIRGTTTIRIESDTPELRLWVYADRLAVAPSTLNQQNARWIFPREIDTTEISLHAFVDDREVEARWDREEVGSPRGRDTRGGDVLIPVGTGSHTVRVEFEYRLPERFGRLGRIGQRFTLTGPWYPIVVDENGSTRHAAPQSIELTIPDDYEAVAPAGEIVDGVLRAEVEGAFVPVAASPRFHVREAELPRGFRVRIRSHRALYEAPPPEAQGPEAIRDLVRADVVGEIVQVAKDVVETLALSEIPAPARTFEIVLVPSRTEMAANAPGLVVVSDRLYEVFPLRQILVFHHRALRRALFRDAIAARVNEVEQPIDRDWTEDLRAVVLSDLDEVRRQGRVQTAQELIGWAGFHPAVDQLLYAPQVAFVDVFFGTVDEPDPFRDAPGRSRAPTSRGRRILESARDVLSEDELRDWSRALLALDESARAAAPESARLDTWITAQGTAVNYRLGEIQSEEREGGYRHRVVVHRDGDPREEPVEVRLTDDEGNSVVETWDGAGNRGELVFETEGDLREVQIDPRSRLVQSARVADGHPRRDDTNRLPWRPPLLQGFNLATSATEGTFIGLLDFALRRRYDLENSVSLRLTTGPRSTGGLLRYGRGIGRKRDTNARIGFVSAGLGLDRLRSDFGESEGGWRTSALVSGGYSTQRYFLDPRHGSILTGSLRGSVVFRDDGTRSYTLAPAVRGNLTLPIGLRAATVLVGGASWIFGDPLSNERPGLGGRFLLRGYQSDEAVGRGRVYAVIEQRFTPTFLSDLNWNLFHLAWVREIQLAVFAGAGAVFFEEDRADRQGRDVIVGAEVGGGIRVHFEYGGIQPGVLALDLSAPLIRRSFDRSFRPPVTFILGFEQYF